MSHGLYGSPTFQAARGFVGSAVLVPVLLLTRMEKSTAPDLDLCVALCVLHLLCITGDFSFVPSDGMVLLGAVFWALHLLVINHMTP